MDNDINKAICNSCVAISPSDTVDLAVPGFVQVQGTAGNVKVLPAVGNTPIILAMDQKEITWCRVRRVYATLTTATTLVLYY